MLLLLSATLVGLPWAAARGQEGGAMVSPAESYTEDASAAIQVKGLYEEVLRFDGMAVHLVVGRVSLVQGDLSFTGSRMAFFVAKTGSGF
ncbi:MAG: hypothetical protein ACKO2P_04835, partial [Planctomycetota bacterium]